VLITLIMFYKLYSKLEREYLFIIKVNIKEVYLVIKRRCIIIKMYLKDYLIININISFNKFIIPIKEEAFIF
jgi:hypothetical protein